MFSHLIQILRFTLQEFNQELNYRTLSFHLEQNIAINALDRLLDSGNNVLKNNKYFVSNVFSFMCT